MTPPLRCCMFLLAGFLALAPAKADLLAGEAGAISPAFRYWKNVRAASCRDRAGIDVEFTPGTVMRVEFALKGGGSFILYQDDSPDLPTKTRAGFYLEVNSPSATVTFQTLLRPRLNS